LTGLAGALYMNYDMVGSPNYIFMVYDADQSTFEAPVAVPPGSTAIEVLYESYYTKIGEPYDDTAFSGRSDYQAFIEAGIPSGGLFTGAEEPKTANSRPSGAAPPARNSTPATTRHATTSTTSTCTPGGQQRPHRLRDADLRLLHRDVNGVAGKRVPGPAFTLPAPAGPEGTFAKGDGGRGPGLIGG
jgi:Zn-dependent M28 family amino/carboxypeptidase